MGSKRVGQDRAAEQQNKPILSTAQRLQNLAHLNSPVTTVNRSLCLTYLGSQFLHRHGATGGKADLWLLVEFRPEQTPCRPHPTSPHPPPAPPAPHEAGGGPQFYLWTWGTRHGAAHEVPRALLRTFRVPRAAGKRATAKSEGTF